MSVSVESHRAWFISHLQRMLSEALDIDVEPDDDGDFPIQGETSRGWVRPICDGPWGVQIFVMAAHGVPDRVAVLRELNDVNASDMAVRVSRFADGTVMASYFLVAEGLGADNLMGAIGRVLTVADQIGPMLVTVHGGYLPAGSESYASEPDA
jgi:Putative bacterial sensory transduction regulator